MARPSFSKMFGLAVIAEDIDDPLNQIVSVLNGGLDTTNLKRGYTISAGRFLEGKSIQVYSGGFEGGNASTVIGVTDTSSGIAPVRAQVALNGAIGITVDILQYPGGTSILGAPMTPSLFNGYPIPGGDVTFGAAATAAFSVANLTALRVLVATFTGATPNTRGVVSLTCKRIHA